MDLIALFWNLMAISVVAIIAAPPVWFALMIYRRIFLNTTKPRKKTKVFVRK